MSGPTGPMDPMVHASQALTIAAELDPARIAELRRRLAVISGDLLGDNPGKPAPALDAAKVAFRNPHFRPGALPDTHFMRFVIVEDATLPPLLLWECNHDGSTESYLAAVHDEAGRSGLLDFDHVFEACRGYPGLAAGRGPWVEWMADHAIAANAFYCGYRGVAKRHVDAAGRVHEAIRRFLDADRDLLPVDAVELHGFVRGYLEQSPPPQPMHPGDLEPIPVRDTFTEDPRLRRAMMRLLRPVWGTWLVLTAGMLGGEVALGWPWWTWLLAPLGAAAVTALLFWLAWKYLRFREARDKPAAIHRAVHGKPDLIAVEDRIVQNQLTHLVDLKPGWFRYRLLHIVLDVIDLLARFYYLNGHLGHIASIHFGRWVVLKDPRPRWAGRRRHRLVFFSNYDFSWDSYLGEFVDRQATGLTAVWSNTEGFPRTRALIKEGATDEERFKQWARDRQIPSQVWWSGVRHFSVENVTNDVAIHRGLTTRPADLRRWLLRL